MRRGQCSAPRDGSGCWIFEIDEVECSKGLRCCLSNGWADSGPQAKGVSGLMQDEEPLKSM